jgi:hypothetical protein
MRDLSHSRQQSPVLSEKLSPSVMQLRGSRGVRKAIAAEFRTNRA